MKTCNNCGAQVEDVAKFCPECGFKFGAIAEPRAAVTDIYDHTSEFSPEDIANMVLFLCSDQAGFITGENICIDGGMTHQMIYHGDFGWNLK